MKRTAPHQRATRRWMARKGNPQRLADEAAYANGCWFDPAAAQHVCDFFETFLRHSKGQWAGEPFTLLPWQANEVLKPLFGWQRADGTRRYRTAFLEIPKKNGKSTLGAGLALYGLVGDDEPGAEVYSAAASREQAAIVYREAASMVKASPALTRRLTLTTSQKHMADPTTNSWYKALSADVGTNEGMNIHFLLMDEMHAQKNDAFWNALMYGGAARRQPLQVIITTAGVETASLCYALHVKAMQVMEGTIQDDSFFAYVRSAEWPIRRATDEAAKEACWQDPAVWQEANPSLGQTISREGFREDFLTAVQSPRLQNAFKRYRLNLWTQQAERWLSLEHWAACGEALEEDALRGQACWAGLDLASTSDLCALVLWFPEGQRLLPYFWVPEETVERLEGKGDPTYATWVTQGFLQVTAGNVTDYDVIREAITTLAGRFQLQELAYDRWGATQLITQLQGDGLACVGFGQGFASMSAPSKEFERLILSHDLRHGQHPVLTWCVGNVAAQSDAAGNIKPSKALSPQKIDGVVAAIMALGRVMVHQPPKGSVYEGRGLLTL